MTTNHPARYPTNSEDVTADRLARHMTVEAQHNFLITNATEFNRAAMAGFVYGWGVAFLLRKLQEHASPEVADEVARDLWAAWDDGSSLGEFTWEWLTEYGIDPEAIR